MTDPGATPWYALDARQRSGALPVVVTVAGWTRPTAELAVEFARGTQVLAHVPLAGSVVPADRRLLAPPDADTVRLAVAAGPTGPATLSRRHRRRRATGSGDTPLASLPRAPVLTPMTQVLPRGTRAILDWPVAFVFPCLTPEPLPPGTAGLRALQGRAAVGRPVGRHHLHARPRRPVRHRAAARHAAPDADLRPRRPHPGGTPALPLGPGRTDGHPDADDPEPDRRHTRYAVHLRVPRLDTGVRAPGRADPDVREWKSRAHRPEDGRTA